MFDVLLFGVGAAVLVLSLQIALMASGRGLMWDDWIKRTAADLHMKGTLLAVATAAVLLGVNAALSGWPVFVGAWLGRKLSEWGMDALHGTGAFRRAPRIIEHRDGRRALVDARRGAGYRRLEE